MPRYRAKKTGFYANVLRVPGTPSEVIVTDEPLKSVPDWMEEIKETPAKPKAVKRGGKRKVVAGAQEAPQADPSADLSFKGSVQEL